VTNEVLIEVDTNDSHLLIIFLIKDNPGWLASNHPRSKHPGPQKDLGTLDNTLSPETTTTNGKSITGAVLFVFLQIRTTSANMTG
jgi:hypothetical protein